MSTRPTIGYRLTTGKDGRPVRTRVNSYVVLLTEIGGDSVAAIRYDNYTNKHELMKYVWEQLPDWKIKTVLKLYDDDFQEGTS